MVRRIPIVFAAGNVRNDGVDGVCNLSTAEGFPNFRTVVAPGTAKNVITVGAIDADTNEMTEFSGWGPTLAGLLKPDIVAPGCRRVSDGVYGIISTVPRTGVGRSCGTSMATPAVTGMVALMVEKMVKLGRAKTAVHPSTYKALLIHAAEDIGRPGPDYEFGWGRVRLGATLKLMDDQAFQQGRVDREGQVATLGVTAQAGAREIKATLVWDDRPTDVESTETLSNDLDLVLVGPDGRRHQPLVLTPEKGRERDPARPGVDRLNVVEQVVVKSPAPGPWRVEVTATRIGSPTGGQTYSLVTTTE
jgi:subtilisin family serine protease